jgi:hypothetical protein
MLAIDTGTNNSIINMKKKIQRIIIPVTRNESSMHGRVKHVKQFLVLTEVAVKVQCYTRCSKPVTNIIFPNSHK